MLLKEYDLKNREEDFRLLGAEAIESLKQELNPDWLVKETHQIERKFLFNTYLEGLHFANLVAHLSEEINHHADIFLSFKRVELTIWTHNVKGLTKADFVLAAKIDALF